MAGRKTLTQAWTVVWRQAGSMVWIMAGRQAGTVDWRLILAYVGHHLLTMMVLELVEGWLNTNKKLNCKVTLKSLVSSPAMRTACRYSTKSGVKHFIVLEVPTNCIFSS